MADRITLTGQVVESGACYDDRCGGDARDMVIENRIGIWRIVGSMLPDGFIGKTVRVTVETIEVTP